MYDYVYGNVDGEHAPWENYRSIITKVEIAEGITRIGNNAFIECTRMRYAIMPQSLLSIGDYAFYKCTNTLRNMVESVNAAYASYNQMQLDAIRKMILANPAMQQWQVENLVK